MMLAMGCFAFAQPRVYPSENTGIQYQKPIKTSFKKLPVMKELPNALEGVKDFGDWERRRNEIASMIQHWGIGQKPSVDPSQVKAHMEGDTALVVDVTVGKETLTLRSVIRYPKVGKPPYALMIGTSGISLPRDLFTDRPIATMVFHEKQVNDYGQWGQHHERGEHNFDHLYPKLKDNGAYSEWAWGLSRLIDGLQQLGPEKTKIDTQHIGVTGCSYAGKMALYCGAFDERVALTIAQEPGGGGAAAWRVSHTLENVESLERTDNHWFLESMLKDFGNDGVYRLPYDQHELCAMVCPRALLLLGNPDYQWLADDAMLVSAKEAKKVWNSFGIGDRMGWSIVDGHGHCQLPASQRPEVEAFIDKFLLNKEVDTRDISIVSQKPKSPNGQLTAQVKNDTLLINNSGRTVLCLPKVGIGNALLNGQNLIFSRKVKADYEMLAGKRSHCTNEANEYCAILDANTTLVLRLYNDGIALRYELTGLNNEKMPEEQTTYRIAEGTNRWMMEWSDGYEGFYPLSTTGESRRHHWGYPCLIQAVPQMAGFRSQSPAIYTLLTEANIERRQSASSLKNDQDKELFRVCPDQNELLLSGDWHTPWRVAIIGTLAKVVESTLVTDVSEPCKLADTSWIKPGVVSWVYWAYNHGSNDYNIIKKYVDLAVALKLPYVLIDAEWDEMKDGKTIEDAVNYAKEKGIKPMIWYNSSVGWVNGAPGPKFRLNKPEDREKEFAWCESIGVAGVKIDFFSGDTQLNMDYCQELLECGARHHLLVNFHGATIPRGWQRTYPNLLSTEGVYGAEWYNNVPTFTNRAAAHNATIPFTRNVIGPMDYTPCAFSDSQHPHITSHAHELALTVLYESGLQHLADRPESFLAQPKEVQAFFGQLPAAWDETRLVAGEPADHVVMARRSGKTWYVAGINGTDAEKTINVSLDFIKGTNAQLFADSGNKENPWSIQSLKELPKSLTCQPRGGFVLIIH